MSNEEIWKPIIEEDQPTGYAISSHGSVRDEDGELCKVCENNLGYFTFYLKINGKKKRLIIHRLVALNFIDNPNNFHHIQHLDGNMFNNRINNLKWISHPSCISKSNKLIEASLNEEIWKPLNMDDQQTGYAISSFGSVRDENGELCKLGNYKGCYAFYLKINGKKKQLNIHRLVALHFVDNPDKLKYVQHVDGNMFNNHVDNLKWVSSTRCFIPIDPENKELSDNANWKPIYINGELTNYNISDGGDVQIVDTLKLYKLYTNNGYATCSLTHKGETYPKQVHRLVAEAFIPNVEEKKQVNHINHNRLDNRVANLEWVTASENIQHSHKKVGRKSCRTPIIGRNLDGTEVRYDSVSQARKELGQGVNNCLAGRQEQAYGCTWTYENEREKIEIDLNEFIPIQNHPKHLISKDARIYSCSRKKFLALTPQEYSYTRVILNNKSYNIHRLVALHFIDKPEHYDDTTSLVVNHKDGDKLHNSVENLEWVSPSENTRHARDTGLYKTVKPIVQMDLEGNIVKEYLHTGHASRALALGRNVSSHLLKVCKNPNKPIAYGFRWGFK